MGQYRIKVTGQPLIEEQEEHSLQASKITDTQGALLDNSETNAVLAWWANRISNDMNVKEENGFLC